MLPSKGRYVDWDRMKLLFELQSLWLDLVGVSCSLRRAAKGHSVAAGASQKAGLPINSIIF